MFRLTYRDPHDRDHSRIEYFDDIKSLGQALINIVDNEKEENSAMDWCSRAHWGDKVVRQQFGYKIECFNEEKLKADIQAVADEISKHCGVANSFVGWDNDALTWDFNLGTTYMKFHDQYGYHMSIEDYNKDGSNKHIGEFTSKDKQQFIDSCVKLLTEYDAEQTKTKEYYCRFVTGHTYMGRCEKTLQNMSILVTKKTPQYIFYQTDTGLTGRAIVKYMGGHEAILIKKANNLVVSSANKWS